jgi:hypothetical protein
VVVRHDGEIGLQGLRTALSLALGDRPPALFLLGPALALLDAAPGSEAGECVRTLTAELGVRLWAEGRDGDRAALLREAAGPSLAQVF